MRDIGFILLVMVAITIFATSVVDLVNTPRVGQACGEDAHWQREVNIATGGPSLLCAQDFIRGSIAR